MKAKDKAAELVNKYYQYFESNTNAKECALIAVDEILSVVWYVPIDIEYWEEVKKEIENL